MADTDVLSIRISAILKSRIKSEAEKRGEKLAQFVAEACRMRLDGAGIEHISSSPPPPHYQVASTDYPGLECSKPDMQMLRDVCAGKRFTMPATQDAPGKPCPYIEYDSDSGESYRCVLSEHPAKIKHVRGAIV